MLFCQNDGAESANSSFTQALDQSNGGVTDMFNTSKNTRGKPVKGYRFLFFTTVMIIALVIVTVLNVSSMQEESINIIEVRKNQT